MATPKKISDARSATAKPKARELTTAEKFEQIAEKFKPVEQPLHKVILRDRKS